MQLLPAWALATILAGCGNTATTAPSGGSNSSGAVPAQTNAAPPAVPATAQRRESLEPHYHLDQAQTKLPRVRLHLSTKSVDAELCTTLTQVATGLMFRPGIGPNDAMLFVFRGGARRSFYMKNVDFDINAAYIDTEGVIRQIVTLKKREETPVPSEADNIQFVLETAPDWFTRNGIGVGTLIQTDQGDLRSTLAHLAQLQ